MKVTVCQLRDKENDLNKDWYILVEHVKEQQSDLVLLPEMPFYPWVAGSENPLDQVKREAVKYHDLWLKRFHELAPAMVAYTRPVFENNHFYNKGYIWQPSIGHQYLHTKHYLPNAPNFWEENWFSRDMQEPDTFTINGIRFGFLICTELWFMEMARKYGHQGVDIILSPRATGAGSVNKWIRGGQTVSNISGAFCLSSNRGGVDERGFHWGGNGWITEPMHGELLRLTQDQNPIITHEIDIQQAREAKNKYPRTVKE